MLVLLLLSSAVAVAAAAGAAAGAGAGAGAAAAAVDDDDDVVPAVIVAVVIVVVVAVVVVAAPSSSSSPFASPITTVNPSGSPKTLKSRGICALPKEPMWEDEEEEQAACFAPERVPWKLTVQVSVTGTMPQ